MPGKMQETRECQERGAWAKPKGQSNIWKQCWSEIMHRRCFRELQMQPWECGLCTAPAGRAAGDRALSAPNRPALGLEAGP